MAAAATLRPTVRFLAPSQLQTRFAATAAARPAASASPPEALRIEPNAGPSRLPFVAGPSRTRDASARPRKTKASRLAIARDEQTVHRPGREHAWTSLSAKRKGKARLLDEDHAEAVISVCTNFRPQFMPAPTDFPTPRMLFVPPTSDLLLAVGKKDHHLRDLWQQAIESASFSDALKYIAAVPFRASAPDRSLKDLRALVFLHLLHKVRSPQDALLAMKHLHLVQHELVYHAHAVSVLLERSFRDLRAAHLAQPLYERVVHLVDRIHQQHLPFAIAIPRPSVRLKRSRVLGKRYENNSEARRARQRTVGQHLAGDVLLRLALLLPHMSDERAMQTAVSLLYFMASRCRTSGTFDARTGWNLPRRYRRFLHRSKATRHSMFSHHFLIRITRALLGTSSSNLSRHARSALDFTILAPPALCSALHLHMDPSIRRRGLPNHLTFSRDTRWLSRSLAQLCLGILAYLPTVGSGQSSNILPFDLEALMLAAVRQNHVGRGNDALRKIIQLRWGNKVTSQRSSAGHSRPIGDSITFLSDEDEGAKETGGSEWSSHQAANALVLLTKINKSIRQVFNTSHPRSSRPHPAAYQDILDHVFHDAIKEDPAFAALSYVKDAVPPPLLEQDRGKINWAAFHSAVRGLEIVAQGHQIRVKNVLAWLDLDECGRDLAYKHSAPSSKMGSRVPERMSQVPQAYINALHGFSERGAIQACDAVFHAYLRRATYGGQTFSRLRLTSWFLERRWASVLRVAGEMDLKRKHRTAITALLAERANQIFALVDLRALPIVGKKNVEVLDVRSLTHWHVEPSAALISGIVKGLSVWHLDAFAALRVFRGAEKRWPALCFDADMLLGLCMAAKRLVSLPAGLPEQPWTLLKMALRTFRTHLFVQHPELRDMKAIFWLPWRADAQLSESDCSKTLGEVELNAPGPHRVINFDRKLLKLYISLLSAIVRRRLTTDSRLLGNRIYIHELVCTLVWMQQLNIRPDADLLAPIVGLLRYLYRMRGWSWLVHQSHMPASGDEERRELWLENFGPLAPKLIEWVRMAPHEVRDTGFRAALFEAQMHEECGNHEMARHAHPEHHLHRDHLTTDTRRGKSEEEGARQRKLGRKANTAKANERHRSVLRQWI
ncbi:hypothetical protein OC842_005431 [Tilletia horrida]|uniref:Uncharacterized protein n=1 Tax=Tilletia horrida TaxID=155126 RepID=A0AAN6JPC6_9BASI|nr:hypothetical protein OC842_005431 [Tilletia horrida]